MNGALQSPGMIKQVLYNNKYILPPVYYRALELLLTPCCDISIVSASAICDPNASGKYIVTVTLSNPISLLGKGLIYVFADKVRAKIGQSSSLNGTGYTWNDTNSITIPAVSISPDSSGDHEVAIQLFLPTNTSGSKGVTVNPTNTVTVTFPAC